MKNSNKALTTESYLYTLAGALLLALAAYSFQLRGPQPKVVGSFLIGYGFLLMLVCTPASMLFAGRGLSMGAWAAARVCAVPALLRELGAFLAVRCRERLDVLGLLLVTLLGAGLRAIFLSQPMRMDESYTFLYYLNSGRDPFYYAIPNNHVLHSLLAWLSVALFGMGPAAMRLPAFLAGVLCIPLAFFVGKAFHKAAGLPAALGTAIFPYLVLYSSMARGYAFIVLFTLVLLLLGKFLLELEKPSPAGCLLIALVSALGMLTMPTMLFPLAGFHLWMTLSLLLRRDSLRSILRDFLLPCALLTALLTVLFYTPTVISSNGAGAIFSNQYVDARSWAEFSRRLLPHFQQTLADFTRDVPRPVQLVGLLLALAGVFAVWRRRDWAALLLIPAILLGGLAVLFAKQAIPFARTWIYLIPFALLFADLGYAWLVEKLPSGLRFAPAALLIATGLFLGGRLVSNNAVADYKDTGAFPEASVVAHYLQPLMTGNEYIVVRDTANYSTFYYLCYYGAPVQSKAIDPATAKRYFIVQKSYYSLKDLTSEPASLLFEYGDAAIYTSSGGAQPHFPSYTFDCSNTRK